MCRTAVSSSHIGRVYPSLNIRQYQDWELSFTVVKQGSKIKDRQKIITHISSCVNHDSNSVVRRPQQSTSRRGSAVPRVLSSSLFFTYTHTHTYVHIDATYTDSHRPTPFSTLGSGIVIISSSDRGGKTDC